MEQDPLRVMVVDDTVTYRKIVADILSHIPGVEVIGSAAHGRIALQKIETSQPDLMTLDLEMPEMDGLALLRAMKDAGHRVGAIMLSAFTTQGADATVEALKLGAFDFVVKPSGPDMVANAAALEKGLRQKIEAFTKARAPRPVIPVGAPRLAPSPVSPAIAPMPSSDVAQRMSRIVRTPHSKPELVVIGISTGGPEALNRMLPMLPADLSAPVLVVQHMPPKFTLSLANDLATRCRLKVNEACEGDMVRSGQILIAPGGRQMKVVRPIVGGPLTVALTDDPPENHCRPSVDYLFRSAAHLCGERTLAVIMTGMGNDGTLGCRLLKRQGAWVVAQDEASCVVYGMPKAPVDEGLTDVVAPLNEIAGHIAKITGRGAGSCN